MTDTREALERLLFEHQDSLGCACSCGESFEAWDGKRAHVANMILAVLLVVPRSDIQGYEYAHQYSSPVGGVWTYPADSREHVLGKVAHRRNGDPRPEVTYTALERPILPWSVIPLPEDGEQQ